MTKELGGTLTLHYKNPKTGIDQPIFLYGDPERRNVVRAVYRLWGLNHREAQMVVLHQPLELESEPRT
jgi:hypothetical protein